MKKVLIAVAVLTIFRGPTLAQSFSASPYGTGNVLPFSYGPAAADKGKAVAVRRKALDAFARAAGDRPTDPNSPENTGGGSIGYNEMLLKQ